jgi:hypothetical protein
MSNNSNQTGALLLLAVVLGATVYALMFLSSEVEQKNMSVSYGSMAKRSASKSIFETPKVFTSNSPSSEIRSDLSGVSLPAHKMKSTTVGDYAQYSTTDFIISDIVQVDVQNLNNTSSVAKTNTTVHYASNYSQSLMIGNSAVEYISNSQSPTKSDITGLLLLDTRAAEVAMTQQGSKRATPALKGKTAAVSTSLTDKGAKKVGGGEDPGEPNPGGSLPVGDGVMTLLLLLCVYSISRFTIRDLPKENSYNLQ